MRQIPVVNFPFFVPDRIIIVKTRPHRLTFKKEGQKWTAIGTKRLYIMHLFFLELILNYCTEPCSERQDASVFIRTNPKQLCPVSIEGGQKTCRQSLLRIANTQYRENNWETRKSDTKLRRQGLDLMTIMHDKILQGCKETAGYTVHKTRITQNRWTQSGHRPLIGCGLEQDQRKNPKT